MAHINEISPHPSLDKDTGYLYQLLAGIVGGGGGGTIGGALETTQTAVEALLTTIRNNLDNLQEIEGQFVKDTDNDRVVWLETEIDESTGVKTYIYYDQPNGTVVTVGTTIEPISESTTAEAAGYVDLYTTGAFTIPANAYSFSVTPLDNVANYDFNGQTYDPNIVASIGDEAMQISGKIRTFPAMTGNGNGTNLFVQYQL